MQKNKIQQSLNFKYLISFFLMGLFLIGPLAYSQTQKDSPEVQEEHDTKNLNKLLNDYNKDQEKVLKDAETIQDMQATDESQDVPASDIDSPAIKKADLSLFDSSFRRKQELKDLKDLKKVKYSQAIKAAIAPLQKMSEEELLTLLKNNAGSSVGAAYIVRYPKLALFSVKIIRDKDAIPEFAKVFDDQEKLIQFAAVMLFTVIFGFILKRIMKKEGRGVLAAIFFWFIRFMILTSVRLAILYYFYAKEITPTLNLAYKIITI